MEGVDERLPPNRVLICGSGPVGLVLATTLAKYGVSSAILEKNSTTTKWPKMDLTNARSMELFRTLGIADKLREQGVSKNTPYTVRFTAGLHEEKSITTWDHNNVEEYRTKIANQNDGTLPLEPYQRISQVIFEAWIKEQCEKNPLVDIRSEWRVDSLQETDSGTVVTANDLKTGSTRKIFTHFLAGCDGASSVVRGSLGIRLDGGPLPVRVLLVHFRSADLTRLHRQGYFWHLFVLGRGRFWGAVIAQDDKDTFTVHLNLPPGADADKVDSCEAIYTVLGGTGPKFEIKVDEILVRSVYRPTIAVAQQYINSRESIFLAGDSAHQNLPTGGFGMNMGLGDAFNLGWKLAAIIKGHGGLGLLRSYEEERRPVAINTIERSKVYSAVHSKASMILGGISSTELKSAAGIEKQRRIHELYQKNDGENRDVGIQMALRYHSSICIQDPTRDEPLWKPSGYIPTTWPGSRAPHVFLNDGSAIFDHLGDFFSLVDFSTIREKPNGSEFLLDYADRKNVPLKYLRFPEEAHARLVWENVRLIIVRPDQHVAWRGDSVPSQSHAASIIDTISGFAPTNQIGQYRSKGIAGARL